jgi:hypothetical protein
MSADNLANRQDFFDAVGGLARSKGPGIRGMSA